jgi:D-alanyl-D-alanine dipeptidase
MSKPAGKDWVGRFPTSKSVSDLKGSFQGSVKKFIAALTKAGATVAISATYRPPERAYLMHWSYKIAKGQDPAKVPSMSGVDIDWVLKDKAGKPDAAASKKAAQEMVAAYGIAYAPALKSRHTEGSAIDMTIAWSGTLTIDGPDGKPVSITSSPRDGGNKDLQDLGARYGVVKLKSDPPHWSTDGH